MRKLGGAALKRLVLETLGWVLVVVGIAALVLPGPGLLALFAGVALLSQQYEWAERRLEPLKRRALQAAKEGVETWPRVIMSVLAAVLLLACGVLWTWNPPAPDWWPLADSLWLIGGAATGATQIGSAIIAMALVVYSFRRFRTGPT